MGKSNSKKIHNEFDLVNVINGKYPNHEKSKIADRRLELRMYG